MTKEMIREMIEQNGVQTPCYLFDVDELTDRVRRIQEELAVCGSGLCFAIKANPFLISALDAVIPKYEVCSPGELEICRAVCIAGEKIIFSGVVKSEEDIRTALAYPVETITVESYRQWQLLKECAASSDRKTKVLLRLSSGAQFGMERETVLQVAEELKAVPQLVFGGLHYFAGTQRKGCKYEKELPMLAELMGELREKYGANDMILEYGPGLPTSYFEGDSFENPFEGIQNLAAYIAAQRYPFRVNIELGRYIAASCGHYVTRIVDCKTAEERNYCLVDGGIHHVVYYGQNMAMRRPIVHHIAAGEPDGEEQEYMICGSLCTFADLLVRGLPLRNPQIGDWLVFDQIGAYSVTEAAYLFLSRNLPAVYLYSKEKGIRSVRDSVAAWEINAGKLETYVRK